MPTVGYSSVANLANTSDGFAEQVNAKNDPADTTFGKSVGDGGVVDLYHGTTPPVKSFILMENSGYVLEEDNVSKIQLEIG